MGLNCHVPDISTINPGVLLPRRFSFSCPMLSDEAAMRWHLPAARGVRPCRREPSDPPSVRWEPTEGHGIRGGEQPVGLMLTFLKVSYETQSRQ